FLVAMAVFIASHGKPYYLAPFYPALIAVGAMVCERHIGSWRPIAIVWVIGGAIAFVCTVPVLPIETARQLGLYRVNGERVLLATIYRDVSPIGQVRGQFDLDNQFDFPRVIYRCRGKLATLRDKWPLLRRFD